MSHRVKTHMRRGICTILLTLFAMAPAAFSQNNALEKASDKEKIGETKAATEGKAEAAPKKADSLEDFEKQLQKELETTPDRSATPTEQPSVLWQFIRTLLTLAVLLGIFYGIFKLYKFKRELPAQNFSAVSSIYEYPLGQNQRLQIIELAGKLMVLGVSENSIQLISEISDKYTVDRIKLDCAEDRKQPRADFLTELSRAIKTNIAERVGKKNSANFSAAVDNSADTLEAQRENSMQRLRRLKSEKMDWRDKL